MFRCHTLGGKMKKIQGVDYVPLSHSRCYRHPPPLTRPKHMTIRAMLWDGGYGKTLPLVVTATCRPISPADRSPTASSALQPPATHGSAGRPAVPTRRAEHVFKNNKCSRARRKRRTRGGVAAGLTFSRVDHHSELEKLGGAAHRPGTN